MLNPDIAGAEAYIDPPTTVGVGMVARAHGRTSTPRYTGVADVARRGFGHLCGRLVAVVAGAEK